jgi:aminoglycoside phosphotransferase (APT) family kinase protein
MHAGEFPLGVAQAAATIRAEFPQWRDWDVQPVASSGTVNRIFRLGDSLSARFPLVVGDATDEITHVEAESAAARELQSEISFLVPQSIAIGHPGADYPGHWAIHEWLDGTPASTDLASSSKFARHVAQLIVELRAIPVRGRTFRGYGRGNDLTFSEKWLETCFNKSDGLRDVTRLRTLWGAMKALPRLDDDVMTHGDLLPGNLLVNGDNLVGVLDVGSFGPADSALDLMGLWTLFDRERRDVVRRQLNCGDLEWCRGRAWAFEQAMGALWYYVDSNPVMSRWGQIALDRIEEDFA